MTKPQSLLRVGLFPIGILLIVFVLVTQQVMAAPPSVTLSAPVNISNTSQRARWPSIAFDREGKAHIVWLQQGDVSEPGNIMYSNNRGGTFSRPKEIADGEGSADHTTSIAVQGDDVHVLASTTGNRLTHIRLDLNGNVRLPRTPLNNGKATSSALTVDSAGVVHGVYISNSPGQYRVFHRRWLNGGWEPTTRIIKNSGGMQKFPSLAATKDGRVHLAFREGDPTGSFDYWEWNGTNWVDGPNPAFGSNNDQVSLGSDGTNLYAVAELSGPHVLNYARRINAIGNWTGSSRAPGQDTYNNQPTFFGSAAGGGRGYAVWSRGGTSGEREEIVLGEVTPNGGWSDIVRLREGEPEGARGASCGAQIGIVWHDKPSGDIFFVGSTSSAAAEIAQLFDNQVYLPLVISSPTPPPPSC